MPTTQAGKTPKNEGRPRSGARGAGGGSGVEPDENYNLIAILYRSLQSAERCDQYVEDAEESGDRELADFFQDTCEEYRQRAAKARGMLAARLGGEMNEEDEDDEEEE